MDTNSKYIWKRNNVFVTFLLTIYILLIYVFSSNYLVNTIVFTSKTDINYEIEKSFIGESIHLINIDQIIDTYLLDPHIEKVSIEKDYPDGLYIKIDKYSSLALVTDLRTDTPMYYKLYKNSNIVKVSFSDLTDNDFNGNSIKIVNGPLANKIYGEFVNYFLLLRTTDQSIVTNFVVVGDELTGNIGNLTIDFIDSMNLGTKASAVYQRIKEPCPSESFTINMDDMVNQVIIICDI